MNFIGFAKMRGESPNLTFAVFAPCCCLSMEEKVLRASESTTKNPTLCRVEVYSAPGLPKPMTSNI
jgi:hypothetical protein